MLFVAGLVQPVFATDYYVSTSGSDSNAGTAAGSAWRTIEKVNNQTFGPGDRVLFQAGQTFAGTIYLTAADGGVASNPVTVGSFGTGRATINGGAGSGLSLRGTTGIRVVNLNFIGLGRKTGNEKGMGVQVANANGITIDQVDASGFQRAGVDFAYSSNVRLTNVFAHNNGYAGIAGYSATDVYIGYCRAIRNSGDPTITTNHSGNGIVVSGRRIVIEYSEAAYNGYDMQQVYNNGPVGIWCHDADQVTIQHCISHNNSSPKGDGGGFDLDGGVTNSVVQYNYAYENKNYGFLAWEYGSSVQWSGNVFRFNISANNYGPGLLLGANGSQGLQNCEVYNNVFYSSAYPAVTQMGPTVNVNLRNNIFMGPNSSSLVTTASGLLYQANAYWSTNGGFNVGGYKSLQEWANATGQEKLNGTVVGINANPGFQDPANYQKLTDPARLPSLTSFLVPATSPVVDKGVNLRATFNIDPGTRDFYGKALPTSTGTDIGAQEAGSATQTPTTTPTSTGCTGTGSLQYEVWNNVSGSTVSSIPTGSAPSSTSAINSFEAPAQTLYNYGARTRGYVCAPVSGAYTFWVVGDDAAELFLSTDADPAKKVRIASCAGWTSGNRDFTRMASQQSATIQLTAGTRYYVEALHKQSWGPGYLAVAWRLPNGTRQEPIPGASLVPFGAIPTPTPTPTPTPVPAPSQPNLALNPGFEADKGPVQAPASWYTWAGSAGTDADADLTETTGGAYAGTYHGAHRKDRPYEVYTYQVVKGLANGYYTLRAWTKSSGGQTHAMLLAKNFGSGQVSARLPATAGGVAGAWQQVELKDINVTNGSCEIALYSNAAAGQWLLFDEVTLVSQAATASKSTSAVTSPASNAAEVRAEPQSWPNPVQNELQVSYPSAENQVVEVQLSNLQSARVQLRHKQSVFPGNNQFSLNTSALKPGLYLLQINGGKQPYSQRISVERP
ncbi:right-handed parallel beta-helix repeat-containing protein [Hymenobacter arizonensis]|uniref:right-handed parallel beta-helix repeat-containing protein n=1 Tax=Hymenobacter arizonensis TaxID=1227077 RepID=UPI0015A6025C|nr:right-handed parallel beta-helix repeat-containing protein [Hymenobacter arizonensis]